MLFSLSLQLFFYSQSFPPLPNTPVPQNRARKARTAKDRYDGHKSKQKPDTGVTTASQTAQVPFLSRGRPSLSNARTLVPALVLFPTASVHAPLPTPIVHLWILASAAPLAISSGAIIQDNAKTSAWRKCAMRRHAGSAAHVILGTRWRVMV